PAESGHRPSRAGPTEPPRTPAISRVSSGCALPENTFSSPKPVAMNGSPMNITPERLPPGLVSRNPERRSTTPRVGWGGRIRTFEYGIQSPAPYRLATPHRHTKPALRALPSALRAPGGGRPEPAAPADA